AGRAVGISHTECIREVENAGRPDERRLPAGAGRGFLWRADTFSTYVEGDNGVYMGFETVGLSRTIPALLGWGVAPLARHLARASAVETLLHLREAILTPGPASPTPSFDIPAFGCAGSNVS